MEKYNQREKEIIKKLVEYKSDFENLKTLGRFFSEKIFPEDIHLITERTGTNNLVYCKKEDKRKTIYFIAELSLLIHSLIKEGLLKPIPGNNEVGCYVGKIEGFNTINENNNIYIYRNGIKTNEYFNSEWTCWYDKNDLVKYELIVFPDNQIPYIDIIGLCPLVSPELEKMAKSNFKTIEQKTLCWTRIAAVASFCGMLGAVTIPFFTTSKIDNTQYDGIISSISKVNTIVQDTVVFEKSDTCMN